MSNEDIIRAWQDEDYWASLDEQKRSQLPENPAGVIELSDRDLETLVGGIKFPGGGTGINDTHCSALDRCPSAWGCQLTRDPHLCIY